MPGSVQEYCARHNWQTSVGLRAELIWCQWAELGGCWKWAETQFRAEAGVWYSHGKRRFWRWSSFLSRCSPEGVEKPSLSICYKNSYWCGFHWHHSDCWKMVKQPTLPFNHNSSETLFCNTCKQSIIAQVLRDCMVWNECPSKEEFDTNLQDIGNNKNLMGGVTVLLAGGKPYLSCHAGNPADEIKACLKTSWL